MILYLGRRASFYVATDSVIDDFSSMKDDSIPINCAWLIIV